MMRRRPSRRSARPSRLKWPKFERLIRVPALVLLELLVRAAAVAAQPPPPAAPVVTISRSWYLEAAIVVVMMGLALYAVCRSSRRN
jgi:hypothetical protein